MRSSEFLLGLLVGFKNNSLDDFYVFIEFLRQNDSFKHTICLLLIQACKNDDDFEYFSQLIIDKKIDVLNFPRLSALKYHNKITNDQFEILIDTLIYVEAIDQVRYVLLDECFFQKKLPIKYLGILLSELRTILKKDSLYDQSEDALEYLLTLDDAHRIKVLKVVKNLFDDDKYISIHRNSKNFKLLKVCVEKSTDLFLPLFLDDQEFLDKFWCNDLRKVLVYADPQSVLNWISHDQNRLQFWIENSNLFIIQDNGQIFWLDLLLNLLNLSDSAQNTLDKIIDANVFTLRSASGSWSEEMRRRLPSIHSLKEKLEREYPELLTLIDAKEKEWLYKIEKQTELDQQEQRQRSERFDW
ncbi:hypothetical protein [Acinetobacter lwoffii]|uniref:hypothetical protein n=1 Tax=Acinetobacter lwoffii TaxID=28090 RepID=UPI003F9059A1